jgi:hypothetical protein
MCISCPERHPLIQDATTAQRWSKTTTKTRTWSDESLVRIPPSHTSSPTRDHLLTLQACGAVLDNFTITEMEVMRLPIKMYPRSYDNKVPGKHYIAVLIYPHGSTSCLLQQGEPRDNEHDAVRSLLEVVRENASDQLFGNRKFYGPAAEPATTSSWLRRREK